MWCSEGLSQRPCVLRFEESLNILLWALSHNDADYFPKFTCHTHSVIFRISGSRRYQRSTVCEVGIEATSRHIDIGEIYSVISCNWFGLKTSVHQRAPCTHIHILIYTEKQYSDDIQKQYNSKFHVLLSYKISPCVRSDQFDGPQEGAVSIQRDVCCGARYKQLHSVPNIELHYPWSPQTHISTSKQTE